MRADADVTPGVAALQERVTNGFRPVGGTDAQLTIVRKGTKPSYGSWWIVLLNDSDQANALGYHDLATEGLPVGKVFAVSDLNAGTSSTVPPATNCWNCWATPNINLTVFVQNGNMAGILNAYEVCEVCETTASVTRSIISCCRISFTRRGLKAFGRRGPLSSIA